MITLQLGLDLPGAVVEYEVVVATAEEFFAAKAGEELLIEKKQPIRQNLRNLFS